MTTSSADLNWIANYIWGIADDVLRDLYVRGKYRDVILPMTVLRRLDALLEDTKQAVLDMRALLDEAGAVEQDSALRAGHGGRPATRPVRGHGRRPSGRGGVRARHRPARHGADRAAGGGRNRGVPAARGAAVRRRCLVPAGQREVGYEISFTRYFYKPKPMRPLAEIRAGILALERETEGLLAEILGYGEPASTR